MIGRALILAFFFLLMAAPMRAQESLEQEADLALARLTALDSLLDVRPAPTREDLSRLDLPAELLSQPARAERLSGMPGTEKPYGVPPFFWGLVLSVPGVVAVYLLTNERRPTHQAIFGAITGGVLFGLLYFIVISGS